MNINDFLWLIYGVIFGWITKIPFFVKYYRDWEQDRDDIRKWMKKSDEEHIAIAIERIKANKHD